MSQDRQREGWGLERASQCSRACNRVVNGALTWAWPRVNAGSDSADGSMNSHPTAPWKSATAPFYEEIWSLFYFFLGWSNGSGLSGRKSIRQQRRNEMEESTPSTENEVSFILAKVIFRAVKLLCDTAHLQDCEIKQVSHWILLQQTYKTLFDFKGKYEASLLLS